MNFFIQLFVGLVCLGVIVYCLKISAYGFLLLSTVPMLLFYPFSFWTLVLSLLLGFLLVLIFLHSSNKLWLVLFVLILGTSLYLTGHKFYQNIGIENVANSQRGEHVNFQSNITAKILHNKSTAIIYYLANLNDRLSLVSIFASGAYSNFSKFLPIGFLFPWYLFGFLAYLKQNLHKYLGVQFVISLMVLVVLSSILEKSSADIFVFSIVWFIGIQSVLHMEKMSKNIIFQTILLNLAYLGMFLLPVNILWNI